MSSKRNTTRPNRTQISGLLQRAYGRLQDPKEKDLWDEAVSELRKGDHYLLVLLDEKPHASVLLSTAWNGLLALAGISKLALLALISGRV